ncbi:type 1 glutamine amidotransferase domain-containing protein [Halorubrum gandharaense]
MKGLIITTDGYEDSEFNYPYYRLQEAGFEVSVATPEGRTVEGKHGYTAEADRSLDEQDPEWFAEEFDLLVIPGGDAPERLRTEAPAATEIVSAFDEREQPIAAICHGPQLLISADVIEDREIAAYETLAVDVENAGATFLDEPTVVDDHLITARVPDDLPWFIEATFEWFADAGFDVEAEADPARV